MKNIYKKILVLFIGVFAILGCSDEWLEEDAKHLSSGDTVYTSYDGFDAGVNGLYSLVRLSWYESDSRGYFFRGGTDSFTGNQVSPNNFGGIFEYWGNTNNSQNGDISRFFLWLYEIVNASNTIINRAESDDSINWSTGPGTDEENKNMILAEAKTIRAWAYRHLSYGWGDVPIVLEESKSSTIRTDWQRNSISEVRALIIEDLLFAEQYIPVEPVAGRLSKGAIQHYLSEMYLTTNDPESALTWADKCINTPNYKLITERYGVNASNDGTALMDMFLDGNKNREEGNTEALWVLQYDQYIAGGAQNRSRRGHMSKYHDISINGVTPFAITYDRGGRGQSRFAMTKWAIELYEEQDERGTNHAIRKYFILKDAEGNAPYESDELPTNYKYGDTIWFDWSEDITFETNNRYNWPWSRKIDGSLVEDPTASNYFGDKVELRLADTYMLKAEAEFKLGNPSGAAETINIIRRRSNASEVSAPVINLDFILDERSRELFLEEERRWTLIRNDKWLERTRLYNNNGGQNITERDKLFPIPQDVIDANITGEFPQNPDYN